MATNPDPPDERLPPKAQNLVIRATRIGDAEALNALRDLPGHRHGTLSLPYQTVEETRRFLESRPAGHVGLVALIGDRLVGAAGLERLAGRRNHVGAIGMGVHDDFIGRGIGTALLLALLDAADNWLNLARVELTVYVDNAPALALYRRHGFAVEGTLKSFAFRSGAFADAYAMARLR